MFCMEQMENKKIIKDSISMKKDLNSYNENSPKISDERGEEKHTWIHDIIFLTSV